MSCFSTNSKSVPRFSQINMIDQIVDRIYIGNYEAAQSLDRRNPEGITHVLNCTPDPHVGLEKFTVKQLNINDGYEVELLDMWFAINTIAEAVKSGGKILVHCHAGISRSTSLVIAYFMTCGLSWDEALKTVRQSRVHAMPHPNIERSIKKNLGYTLITPETSKFNEEVDL